MWHPEMWFTILSPLFYQFISPTLHLIWCLSPPGSPSNPTAVHFSFCFPLTTVSFSHLHFTLPLPLMYFSLSSVTVSHSLWSLCKICAGTSKPVTLLLWPWARCRVEMTPELPGSDLTLLLFFSFSLISTHSLASFHLWTSVPARVNRRADMEGTGVNWEYVLNKKKKTNRIQLDQRSTE